MEKLSDKIRIRAFLQKMLDKRALLTILINGHNEPFSSAVIKVNSDDNSFIIDELKPETGNKLLDKNPVIQLKVQLDGISINYQAEINESGQDDNISFYTLAMPDEIEYNQRRQAVRIRLSAAYPLSVSFNTVNGDSFEGEIKDISIGGIRARFTQELSKSLVNGQHLHCSFLLPPDNEQTLNCDFIIRVIKHKKDQFGLGFLGGEFMNMPKSIVRQLQRSIMTLQRASRQKDNI